MLLTFTKMIQEKHEYAIKWWEKKRIAFNLIILLGGIIGIIIGVENGLGNYSTLSNIDFLEVILWAIIANIIYSMGFFAEALDNYYFKDKFKNMLRIKRFRFALFFILTIVCFVFTLFHALSHLAIPFFW